MHTLGSEIKPSQLRQALVALYAREVIFPCIWIYIPIPNELHNETIWLKLIWKDNAFALDSKLGQLNRTLRIITIECPDVGRINIGRIGTVAKLLGAPKVSIQTEQDGILRWNHWHVTTTGGLTHKNSHALEFDVCNVTKVNFRFFQSHC